MSAVNEGDFVNSSKSEPSMNPLTLLDYCTCANTVVLIVSPEGKEEQLTTKSVQDSYPNLVSILLSSCFQWKSVSKGWLGELSSSFLHKPLISEIKWLRNFENVFLVCRSPVPSVVSWHTYGLLVFSTSDMRGCYRVTEEDIITHIQKWNKYPYVRSPGNLPEPLRGTDGPVSYFNFFSCRIHSQGSPCVNAFLLLSVKQLHPSGI